MPPVTTQRKKTEGWSPITGADQMSNAMLMRTRCVCFASARVRCGAAAFFYLDGGFCLPCDPMKAHQTRRDKSFTFCRGFICCYSCSQTYSAWSNVWVLNVLPETAGRVSVHVSARRCACQRVCVCVQIIPRSEASSCAYSWFLCKKKTDDSGRSRSVNVSVEDWG